MKKNSVIPPMSGRRPRFGISSRMDAAIEKKPQYMKTSITISSNSTNMLVPRPGWPLFANTLYILNGTANSISASPQMK